MNSEEAEAQPISSKYPHKRIFVQMGKSIPRKFVSLTPSIEGGPLPLNQEGPENQNYDYITPTEQGESEEKHCEGMTGEENSELEMIQKGHTIGIQHMNYPMRILKEKNNEQILNIIRI